MNKLAKSIFCVIFVMAFFVVSFGFTNKNNFFVVGTEVLDLVTKVGDYSTEALSFVFDVKLDDDAEVYIKRSYYKTGDYLYLPKDDRPIDGSISYVDIVIPKKSPFSSFLGYSNDPLVDSMNLRKNGFYDKSGNLLYKIGDGGVNFFQNLYQFIYDLFVPNVEGRVDVDWLECTYSDYLRFYQTDQNAFDDALASRGGR